MLDLNLLALRVLPREQSAQASMAPPRRGSRKPEPGFPPLDAGSEQISSERQGGGFLFYLLCFPNPDKPEPKK